MTRTAAPIPPGYTEEEQAIMAIAQAASLAHAASRDKLRDARNDRRRLAKQAERASALAATIDAAAGIEPGQRPAAMAALETACHFDQPASEATAAARRQYAALAEAASASAEASALARLLTYHDVALVEMATHHEIAIARRTETRRQMGDMMRAKREREANDARNLANSQP